MNVKIYIFFALCLLASGASASLSEDVVSLQSEWARINYQLPEKKRSDAFAALAEQADALVSTQPGNVEAHIWTGIIYSTWAGASGPFGAMKRAKRAKAELERALAIQPDALQGSAHTSLGALLYQLPGMMGGDDEAAEGHLLKGIELNPDGIDSNYFYAAFLVDQERFEEASNYLGRASAAPARPGRELADDGRRKEIASLGAEVAKNLR